MDTSETYIKMCDCPEVQQAHWGLIDRDGKRRKERYDDFGATRKSPDWILDVPDIISPSVTILNEDGKTARRINLLVSSQIQEMILELDNFQKIYELSKYIERNDAKYLMGKENRSIEQLWLELYMYRVHSKVWNKDKWIKQ